MNYRHCSRTYLYPLRIQLGHSRKSQLQWYKLSKCEVPILKIGTQNSVLMWYRSEAFGSSSNLALAEFFFWIAVCCSTSIPQVSSVQTITKLSRSIIDDPRSTVILSRCNRTDRRYRPCSPVGGTEPTVDIDRDQPTGRLIGD